MLGTTSQSHGLIVLCGVCAAEGTMPGPVGDLYVTTISVEHTRGPCMSVGKQGKTG